jgi:hypothetical protein
MRKELDAQYSAMAGRDGILLEMMTPKWKLEGQVRRQSTRLEESEREVGLERSARVSLAGRIVRMEERRRSVE